MEELDAIYLRMLRVGIHFLEVAVRLDQFDWLYREADHLHNMPLRIGEGSLHQHSYYRLNEFGLYLDWLRNRPHKKIMNYCGPKWLLLWKEYDAVLPFEVMKTRTDEQLPTTRVEAPMSHLLTVMHWSLVYVRRAGRFEDLEWASKEVEHARQLSLLVNDARAARLHRYLNVDVPKFVAWIEDNRKESADAVTWERPKRWKMLSQCAAG